MSAAAYSQLVDPDIDVCLRRQTSLEVARAEAAVAGASGQSESGLKQRYGEYLKDKKIYDDLQSSLRDLRSKIDQLVANHAAETAPLQAILTDPDTNVDDRVAARVKVNAANTRLESGVKPLTERIHAVQQELELASMKTSAGAVLENAYAAAGPEKDRIRVLRAVRAALDPALFTAKKKCEAAEGEAANARTTLKRGERPRTWATQNLESAEIAAKFHADVAAELSRFDNECYGEIDGIFKRRIQELRNAV